MERERPAAPGDGRALDELRWERRARQLLQRIAVAAAYADSIRSALQVAVDEVCRHMEWPIGHVLLRDGAELVSAGIWHLDDPERYSAFREVSEASRFPAGVGLPGRGLSTGR